MTGDASSPLWRPFVDRLPVDGGSLTIISRTGLSSTISTSDATAARLDQLQLDLHEGPRWDAFTSGLPVLVPDTRTAAAQQAWPLFDAGSADLEVEGVFAVPLVIGVLVVGVADLYRMSASAPWSEEQRTRAALLAAAAAGPAVRLATRSATAGRSVTAASAAELRREIHQATGVLIVRLDLGPEDALLRLEAYAFAAERPMLEIAREVLAGSLDLDAEHPHS